MKKFLVLLLTVALLAVTGCAFAADSSSGGHVIPVDPNPPVDPGTPTPSTGSDEAKTVDAPTATTTTTKTVTIVTTTTTTVTTTTYASAAAQAAAEVKVVKTVTKEEIKQTTTQVTKKIEVQTTASTVANILDNAAVTGGQAGDVDTSKVVSDLLAATTTGEQSATNDTSNQDSTAAMAASLLKGKDAAAGTTTGNISNLDKFRTAGESLAETIMRVIAETVAKVEEKTNAAAEKLAAAITGTTAPVAVKSASAIQNATTTKTVTNADGTTSVVEDDEAISNADAMAALAQQAAQNSDTAAQEALRNQVPVQSTPPMQVEEPGIYPQSTTHKKDMYKKPLIWNVIKAITGGKAKSVMFGAKAIENEGDAVFLNSAGEEVTQVPGEDEWTTDDEGNDVLIIPGLVTTMIYMVPGVTYTPIITTPASAVNEIEGISTKTEEKDVEVVEEKTIENVVVPVYVASDGSYSTSFDETLEEYFEGLGYNTTIGSFIVSGDAGTWAANSPTDTAALAALNQAIVRTLPKIDIKGENAGNTGSYVMKVRFDVPRNDDVQEVKGEDLFTFFPRGFELSGDTIVANPAEAVYLQSNGRDELTDAMIEQIAAGNLGTEVGDGVMGYDGYIVMTLDKLADGESAYTPLVTVKMTKVEQEPVDSGDFTLTASPTVISVKLGETKTSTLTPRNALGTVNYSSSEAWVTVSGNTATIAPTNEALIASSPNRVTITATDLGRTENNKATVTLNINVTSEDEEPTTGGGVGGSGGGCSAGWSVLALALLGGLIARKK